MAAVAHLGAPRPNEARLQLLVRELWNSFFAGFRADEQQFEAQRFRDQVAAVSARVAELGDQDLPDAELAVAMVEGLVGCWDDTFGGFGWSASTS